VASVQPPDASHTSSRAQAPRSPTGSHRRLGKSSVPAALRDRLLRLRLRPRPCAPPPLRWSLLSASAPGGSARFLSLRRSVARMHSTSDSTAAPAVCLWFDLHLARLRSLRIATPTLQGRRAKNRRRGPSAPSASAPFRARATAPRPRGSHSPQPEERSRSTLLCCKVRSTFSLPPR
jgi:hypothetical protein